MDGCVKLEFDVLRGRRRAAPRLWARRRRRATVKHEVNQVYRIRNIVASAAGDVRFVKTGRWWTVVVIAAGEIGAHPLQNNCCQNGLVLAATISCVFAIIDYTIGPAEPSWFRR